MEIKICSTKKACLKYNSLAYAWSSFKRQQLGDTFKCKWASRMVLRDANLLNIIRRKEKEEEMKKKRILLKSCCRRKRKRAKMRNIYFFLLFVVFKLQDLLKSGRKLLKKLKKSISRIQVPFLSLSASSVLMERKNFY